MKRLAYFAVVSLCLLATVVGSALLVWRFEIERLMTTDSIESEIGLSLPAGAHILAAEADIFSFADSDNYSWLIESDTSLLPWAVTNMALERGGWEQIKMLSDFRHFPGKIPSGVKYGGLWRSSAAGRDGREETSYLYLASDGSLGILSTFRP